MKRALILILTIYAVSGSADELKVNQPAPTEVVHVATALDHLTVLEFGEPVTMGTLHMHVHVRRHQRWFLSSLEPVLYPRLHQVSAQTNGANLRFKNPDLARRMNRIFGKNRVASA